ncbi:MAG: HipA N-terminal domain-containing protein [Atopobiaceae bacterium]|nr:HipA N-terminal domain-containing protein [Atopobiaceae bacterium]
MNERIHVWRDTYGAYEHVGLIEATEDHATFRYDRSYHGPAISVRLPVDVEPFSERDTEIFFSALVPE